jgi:dienelactone hydrolase
VVRLGDWIVDAGFTVFVPCLFGDVGERYSLKTNVLEVAKGCVRREFMVFASRRSSPITDYLRALSRFIRDQELGGAGIGAIGMCLTGNFALALMVDEHVMAPVLSQPSLPFPITSAHRRALHLSETNLKQVKARASQGLKVLGLRFTNDFLCPKDRFDSLRSELGAAFESIEIDSSPGNPHNFGRMAHAVLTHDLVDEVGNPTAQARDRVLSFLQEALLED